MRYSEPNEGEEEAELEKLEADKLRREVPCLPDELFDRLPDFLKRGLTHVRNIWKVAIIERSPQMYGGTCVNVGCMVRVASSSLVFRSHK